MAISPAPALRIALFAALAAAGPACRAQSLIANGSFEQGPNPGSFISICPPSTAITGWTVTRDCVHYMGTYWQNAHGARSLDLDALVGDAGGVAQTFATTPGRTYTVSFAMAGNIASGPAIKRMMVAGAGQSAEFTFNITGHTAASMGWARHAWSFTATAATTTLEFWSITSPSGYGPALDDVAVLGCPADFNGDGFLDFFDADAFTACFEGLECPPGQTADFNGDGFVDFFDLDAFIEAFEAGC